MNTGFIKLYRAFKDWSWYGDPSTTQLYIYLMIKANYKAKQYNGATINRGQLVSSRENVCDALRMTPKEYRTRIKRLIENGDIQTETSRKGTIYTLNHYETTQATQGPKNAQTLGGFVLLHRESTNESWFKNPVSVWIYLNSLIHARHTEGLKDGVLMGPGAFFHDRKRNLFDLNLIPLCTYKNALLTLKRANKIEVLKSGKNSLYSIVNYENEQGCNVVKLPELITNETSINMKRTNEGPEKDREKSSTNKGKKEKNLKKDYNNNKDHINIVDKRKNQNDVFNVFKIVRDFGEQNAIALYEKITLQDSHSLDEQRFIQRLTENEFIAFKDIFRTKRRARLKKAAEPNKEAVLLKVV